MPVGYDALLLVSFGGPQSPDEVMPFLRRVTRGRDVPHERLAAVAEHYYHFGGVSPINAYCRELLAALRPALDQAGLDLPLYWGNRNSAPFLAQTFVAMRNDGVRHALAFVTSAFGSYSSCRQYLDDLEAARAAAGPDAPAVGKIRQYHDHPGYLLPHADAVRSAYHSLAGSLTGLASNVDVDGAMESHSPIRLVFTAHSIPATMDASSGPEGGRYSAQMRETAALVARLADLPAHVGWDLVWQSRSGPPGVAWLGPDINDHLAELATAGVHGVVVSPIGFGSDHLEVLWDLDTEAAATASQLGLGYARAATPGVDERFVTMIVDLVLERVKAGYVAARRGELPMWSSCPVGCCPPPLLRRSRA